jgi:hypothetical protein
MKLNVCIGIACLLAGVWLSGCNIGDIDSGDRETMYGSVVISDPSAGYTTSSDRVTLSGVVNYTDNGTLSQISVNWSNAATGASGDAQVQVVCIVGCSISWQTSSIPLAEGDNVITVSAAGDAGYVFYPATITVTRIPIVTISGRVFDLNGIGLAGIPLSLGTQFTATNATGDYSFTVVGNGSYTVSPAWPSTSCFSFSPPSLTTNLTGSSVSGQDFTASAPSPCYKISGRITLGGYSESYGVEATISLIAGSLYVKTTSDANGFYSFSHVPNGTYTIRPSAYYPHTFSPESITAIVNGDDLFAQNFNYY